MGPPLSCKRNCKGRAAARPRPVCHDPPVNWIVWLGLAVLVTAVAAITGIKAKGTRPVASSRLMGVGRFILLLLVLVFAYFAFRARSGS